VAKLYFRYGTMDSAKTMNMLAVAHNYRKQGKRVLLMKPRLDTRFGERTISSRSGLEASADLLIDDSAALVRDDFVGIDCVLVDEAQFLPPHVIDELRRITIDPGVPVICYGLRTDFRTRLFPGSQRLLELADAIEEVKVTCQYCHRKATCNLRFVGGAPTVSGPQVQLGAEEHYAPVCWAHYDQATAGATAHAAPSPAAAPATAATAAAPTTPATTPRSAEGGDSFAQAPGAPAAARDRGMSPSGGAAAGPALERRSSPN
jgi:thymidine kinase